MECVLCRAGDASESRVGSRDAWEAECPRCGTYRATSRAKVQLSSNEQADFDRRTRLTWAARQASDLGKPLDFEPENIETIAQSVVEPHPPIRKLDHLLLLLGHRTAVFGAQVDLVLLNDWPLVFARGNAEFGNLIEALVDEMHYAQRLSGGKFRLTGAGWQRFQQLESERVKSTIAFVAMSFDPSMTPAYDHGFYPALHGLGYDPIRADREQYLGKIDDFIIARLRRSGLVVADFTGMRTGVFFEAGMGLGLGVPVVWTCQEDSAQELAKHFDTRQYNHVLWKDPADLGTRLRTRIEASVIGRPRPRS